MSEPRRVVRVAETVETSKTFPQELLDGVERVGEQSTASGSDFLHPVRAGDRALAPVLLAGHICQLRGRQPRDASSRACDGHRQQPAERRGHPPHADLDGPEFYEFRPCRAGLMTVDHVPAEMADLSHSKLLSGEVGHAIPASQAGGLGVSRKEVWRSPLDLTARAFATFRREPARRALPTAPRRGCGRTLV